MINYIRLTLIYTFYIAGFVIVALTAHQLSNDFTPLCYLSIPAYLSLILLSYIIKI
jgi:hypothetical protein